MIARLLLAVALCLVACGDDGMGGMDAGPAMACTPSGNFCTPEQTCVKSTGFCLGPGNCVARPTVCPALDEPVCGCDGVTYANECEAQRAGQSLEALGACPAP